MNLFQGSCPRPLSRRKLRALMPHNHRDLTARALADKHRRSPGLGRFKSYLEAMEREMEREEHKAAAGTLRDQIHAQLVALRALFQPRSGVKRQLKAARAK